MPLYLPLVAPSAQTYQVSRLVKFPLRWGNVSGLAWLTVAGIARVGSQPPFDSRRIRLGRLAWIAADGSSHHVPKKNLRKKKKFRIPRQSSNFNFPTFAIFSLRWGVDAVRSRWGSSVIFEIRL